LPYSYFESLFRKNCFYCNSEIKTIGLDRIENSVGYIVSNVVACCEMCNRMKWAYSHDEFIDKIIKIYKHTVVDRLVEMKSKEDANVNEI
jgi:uncharacterized protein with PIN domain